MPLKTREICPDELTPEVMARFWQKVRVTSEDDDECWVWVAGSRAKGYGLVALPSGSALAHRVAYVDAYGPLPPGVLVLHTCDNPLCVRPSHLFTGTHIDNMRDMARKGRGSTQIYRGIVAGERNGRAVLTAADVAAIRVMRGHGATIVAIAQVYGVSKSTVGALLTGRSWKGF